jgi:uncharacterized protein
MRPGDWIRLKCFLLLLLAGLLLAGACPAREIPALSGRINDSASILSPATIAQLESVLENLETSDSTQIVVLTVTSLEGDSLERFSLETVEQWKIGQAQMDNGALLLIAVEDRKIRIEVGYGLEGSLTDLVSGQIIRNIITPQFRRGNFNQGVIDGVGAMIAAVQGEFQATTATSTSPSRGERDIGGLMTAMFFILFFFGSMFRNNRLFAGIIGGTVTPVMAFFLFGITGLALLGLVLIGGVGGLLASSMAASSHTRRTAGRTGPLFIPTSGGFGGSSGGFGGFSGGGGGFGGGGASGGW